MIRSTITKQEFEKLTWTAFDAVASNINDISIELVENGMVLISVLGYEIKTMSVNDYKSIIQ